MIFTKILLLIIACRCWPITENEAVYLALQKHPDVVVARLDLKQDSLTFAATRADAELKMTLDGKPLVEFHGEDQSVTSQQGLSLARILPGGGAISATAGQTFSGDSGSTGGRFATVAEAAFTQPLLNNAWRNADARYTIKVESRRLNISREEAREKTLAALSQVRRAYWDWVLARKTMAIRQGELTLSENALLQARVKLLTGVGIELDTLSAALELLKARERVLTAQYDEKSGRKKFALYLELSPDSVTLDPSMAVGLQPLPPLNKIISQGLSQNPGLNVFEETARLLEVERDKEKNRILPRLDLTAGIRDLRYGDSPLKTNAATPVLSNSTDPYVGLQFTLDVLGRGPRIERRRLAAALASNAAEKSYAVRTLSLELETLVEAWRLDSARLEIQRLEVGIAERHYAQAGEAYRLGTVTQLELMKAQTDLISLKLQQVGAEINLKRVEIAVDQSTGLAFERFGITWESP